MYYHLIMEDGLKYKDLSIEELEKIILKDKIMAVIKANAYGHGITEICKALIKIGIKNWK